MLKKRHPDHSLVILILTRLPIRGRRRRRRAANHPCSRRWPPGHSKGFHFRRGYGRPSSGLAVGSLAFHARLRGIANPIAGSLRLLLLIVLSQDDCALIASYSPGETRVRDESPRALPHGAAREACRGQPFR